MNKESSHARQISPGESRGGAGSSGIFNSKDMYPAELEGIEELARQPEIICRGGSVIVSPRGDILAGPVFDEEGILLAELDLADIARGKLDFDVVGHYARPDVFQLTVNEGQGPLDLKP